MRYRFEFGSMRKFDVVQVVSRSLVERTYKFKMNECKNRLQISKPTWSQMILCRKMIHSYSAYFDTHLVIIAINIDHVSILFCGNFFQQQQKNYSNERWHNAFTNMWAARRSCSELSFLRSEQRWAQPKRVKCNVSCANQLKSFSLVIAFCRDSIYPHFWICSYVSR